MLREVAQATQGAHAGRFRNRRTTARQVVQVVDFAGIAPADRAPPVGRVEDRESEHAPRPRRVDAPGAPPRHVTPAAGE